MVARLSRQYGDYDRALAAARSLPRTFYINPFFYRLAYYKEEGDLAAIVGDTSAAIAAYNKYLTLRSDPRIRGRWRKRWRKLERRWRSWWGDREVGGGRKKCRVQSAESCTVHRAA
jgi:hypothetical protein